MGAKEVADELRRSAAILLVGHVNPDGDSIACQLALAEGLEQLGKSVSIRGHDPVPGIYRRLPGAGSIEQTDSIEGQFDTAVLIEIPRWHRSGFEKMPAGRTVGIDHHPDYSLDADVNWVDTSAAAAAEMVFDLLRELGCTMTPTIAENLMAGLMTDSGSFTYPNTTPRTLEIAAALMRAGADTTKIAEMVYRSYPSKRLDLIADLASDLELLCHGQLAIMTMTQEQMRSRGYEHELFEDMVNMPLSAEMVLISALGRQDEEGVWRFSLRSKGDLDVGAVARAFGGGGHRNAAGFRSRDSIEKIRADLAEIVNCSDSLSIGGNE